MVLSAGFMSVFRSLVGGGGLGVADRCEDEQLAVLGHRYSADGQGSETLISLAFFGWENGVGVVGVDRREVAVLWHELVEPRIDSGQNARVPGRPFHEGVDRRGGDGGDSGQPVFGILLEGVEDSRMGTSGKHVAVGCLLSRPALVE